jgi:hypothetical protein
MKGRELRDRERERRKRANVVNLDERKKERRKERKKEKR